MNHHFATAIATELNVAADYGKSLQAAREREPLLANYRTKARQDNFLEYRTPKNPQPP
jgi:hypothetical protein